MSVIDRAIYNAIKEHCPEAKLVTDWVEMYDSPLYIDCEVFVIYFWDSIVAFRYDEQLNKGMSWSGDRNDPDLIPKLIHLIDTTKRESSTASPTTASPT